MGGGNSGDSAMTGFPPTEQGACKQATEEKQRSLAKIHGGAKGE
jgi:hypothetical protein